MSWSAVRAREVIGEGHDVARRRTPPAINRLERITDGSDGVSATVGGSRSREQPPQHDRLRCRGVLILIEQHDSEGSPQRTGHLRHLSGQPSRYAHLIGELHQPEAALQVLVVAYQAGQFETLLAGNDRLLDVDIGVASVVAWRRRQPEQQVASMPVQIAHIHHVLLKIGVESEHSLGHGRGPEPGNEFEWPGRSLHHPRCQSISGCSADQSRICFETQPQPMFGYQPSSEGIVSHDQLFARFIHAAIGDHPGTQQCIAYALGELGSRLPGEGQTEHLFGSHGAGADEPDHAGRHHGGLARSCARDDHAGLERSGDGLQLLRGEGDA